MADPMRERPYVLYTHKLYADGLGSNTPLVLTSWIKGALSRPHINLFPPKFQFGFAGHRFQISAANQPPFIFRIRTLDSSGMGQLRWDGIEFRLLEMISKRLNFSVDITDITSTQALTRGVVDTIQKQIVERTVDIGMSGIYITEERLRKSDMSVGHSRDCAAFITLASKALPKYRAIMGPFQWPVWVALICVYLGGIFPIVFTDRLTLSHLMAFPDTVDSVLDLLGLFFRVGTLNNGGWETWFQNSTHIPTSRLYKKMEFVGTLEEGIGNVTQSFFWNYAFLGSKAQLEYLVQSNFSDENISRRSALHLSEECFALFQIGFLFPQESVYKRKIDSMILLSQQSGLIAKINNEVSWVMQRSSSGRLLQASSSNSLREIIQEERQLTTADTEGMFLLLALGYFLGATALVSEIVGGITNKCRQIIKRSRKSATSSWSSRHSSAASGMAQRTQAEQLAHDERKATRRETAEDAQKMSFGMREFNLTRTTLRELYGSRADQCSGRQVADHAQLGSNVEKYNYLENEEPREAIISLERLDDFMAQFESDPLQEYSPDELFGPNPEHGAKPENN
ncbi:hypothetical protein M5D96_013554 [Drosophila gunungcola]|uniref:Uncharacterized protein n=1 Tax=Drosophila gunungcola TaxID=103775 RepID=A0A9P9YB30_9MUSC|nr:hypothetical protein M5D96_013554 [Drosophila gunungcola]